MKRTILTLFLLLALLVPATAGARATVPAPEVITIRQARDQGSGTVSIQGTVIVTAGSYNAGFAIEDATAGIYVYPTSFFDVSLGDTVILTGTLTSYTCLLQVAPSPDDIQIIGTNPVPDPLPFATGSIGPSSDGWLVVITGTVSGLASDSFYVNDGSGAAYVYIDSTTGISLGSIHNGDLIRVVGFSSQHDTTPPCDGGYEVMPRMQSDLLVIDVTPPHVDSTVPADGATGVSLYDPIVATFSEAVNPATLDFTLSGPGGPVAGAVTYNNTFHRATFTPDEFLSPQSLYTAVIAGTLEDPSGNQMGSDYSWSFTTGNPDVVPPLVTAVKPAPNTQDVSIYTNLVITFSERMNPDTINESTIQLKQGTTPVAGTVTYDDATRSATFRPQALLDENTLYQATVKAGVQDRALNPMGFDYPWSFRTGTAPVMQAYQGDIHNHTSYSDGSGTPTEAFAGAQACGLDFLAVTDHSNSLSAVEWANVLDAANAATQPGVFVGLRGFEYTQGAEGHINVYNTVRYSSRAEAGCDSSVCDYTPNLEAGVTVQGFYPWLAVTGTQALDANGTVMQFNHPGWMNFNDWTYHPEVEDTAQLEEAGNGWGASYVFSYDEWVRSLDYGWKVAPTNNSDNHERNWGCITPHRTGVIMPTLDKESLLSALRERRVFATEDSDFDLFFKGNGYWMGSEIPNNGQLTIDAWGQDDEITDTIAVVQLVSTQGQVVTETYPAAAGFHWTFDLPVTAGSHYFFILVEEADGDRIVSAPIWTGSTDDLRVTDLTVQPSLPTIYNPSLFTARLTNRGDMTQTITVTFSVNGTPQGAFPVTLGACTTGPCSDVFVPISWQPVITGAVTATAAIEGTPIGDNPDDNSRDLHMYVTDERVPLILLDGGHSNVGADPSTARPFVNDMTAHGYNILFNLDDITASDLNTETVKVLILNAFGPDPLTTTETQAIADYIQAGGSLWLNGMSDYGGSVPWAPTIADRENMLIDSIAAQLGVSIPVRMNDDEIVDGNDNNGYPWGVLWHVYPNGDTTGIGMNVSRIQSWSDNSLVDSNYGALTESDMGPDGFLAVVGDTDPATGTYGEDNYTHNTDADNQGDMYPYISPTLVPFAAGYDIPGPAGRILFYGDSNDLFDIFAYAAGDGRQNEAFNLEAVMWLLGDPLQPWTIAHARQDVEQDDTPDYLRRLVWVEGTVTAPYGQFFDCLYVQDDTGGVTVFAPAGDISGTYGLGDQVRVVATVDQYQNDTELQFMEAEQIRIIGHGAVPDPLVLTTHDAALEQNEGWLLQTQGRVTAWVDINSFLIDDGTGPCRVFLDGYNQEDGNPTFESIRPGNWVSAIGLGSEDYTGQRIRVRTESDIQILCDSKLYDASVAGPAWADPGETITLTAVITPSDATPPITYTWAPEPITGQGTPAVTYAWDVTGTYTVNLVVAQDCSGLVEIPVEHPVEVSSCQAPANVGFDLPPTILVGQLLTLTAQAEGTMPMTYNWDLGNGATAEGMAVTYAYTTPGDYTVTLNVANECGEGMSTHVAHVETGCIPPAGVTLNWTPITPTVDEAVAFTGSSAGTTPLTYTWELGDGTTVQGLTVTHSYTATGVYTVTLTAVNACGADSAVDTLTVVVAPPAVWKVYLPVIFKGMQ